MEQLLANGTNTYIYNQSTFTYLHVFFNIPILPKLVCKFIHIKWIYLCIIVYVHEHIFQSLFNIAKVPVTVPYV